MPPHQGGLTGEMSIVFGDTDVYASTKLQSCADSPVDHFSFLSSDENQVQAHSLTGFEDMAAKILLGDSSEASLDSHDMSAEGFEHDSIVPNVSYSNARRHTYDSNGVVTSFDLDSVKVVDDGSDEVFSDFEMDHAIVPEGEQVANTAQLPLAREGDDARLINQFLDGGKTTLAHQSSMGDAGDLLDRAFNGMDSNLLPEVPAEITIVTAVPAVTAMQRQPISPARHCRTIGVRKRRIAEDTTTNERGSNKRSKTADGKPRPNSWQNLRKELLNLEESIPWRAVRYNWRSRRARWRTALKSSTTPGAVLNRMEELRLNLMCTSSDPKQRSTLLDEMKNKSGEEGKLCQLWEFLKEDAILSKSLNKSLDEEDIEDRRRRESGPANEEQAKRMTGTVMDAINAVVDSESNHNSPSIDLVSAVLDDILGTSSACIPRMRALLEEQRNLLANRHL